MLGIDSRALRIAWTVFLLCLTVFVLFRIRDTILVFAAAIFFAYILSPIVSLVERFIPKGRGAALAIVYVLFIGALVGLGFALIPTIASEAMSLVTRLPALLSSGRLATIPLPSWLDPVRSQIIDALKQQASTLEAHVVPLLQAAGARVMSGVSVLLPIVLIPILSFFFLKDAHEIKEALIHSVDRNRDRTTLDLILDDMHNVLTNYIRALVILALISFAVYSLFLRILGVPYELLLAGTAALLEFIPVVGPAATLVIILLVAAITSTGNLLGIIIFWGIYRLFQDYILNPYLMKSGLEIHPLLVLFGVLAGDQIAGVPGMFFSVPVLAILKVVYRHVRGAKRRPELARV